MGRWRAARIPREETLMICFPSFQLAEFKGARGEILEAMGTDWQSGPAWGKSPLHAPVPPRDGKWTWEMDIKPTETGRNGLRGWNV